MYLDRKPITGIVGPTCQEVEPVSAELAQRVRALVARAKMQDIWGPLADLAEARLRAREPQERLRLIRLEHALRDIAEGLL